MKKIRHPHAGRINLEFSSFAVEGRPELGMLVYNPVASEDEAKICALVDADPD